MLRVVLRHICTAAHALPTFTFLPRGLPHLPQRKPSLWTTHRDVPRNRRWRWNRPVCFALSYLCCRSQEGLTGQRHSSLVHCAAAPHWRHGTLPATAVHALAPPPSRHHAFPARPLLLPPSTPAPATALQAPAPHALQQPAFACTFCGAVDRAKHSNEERSACATRGANVRHRTLRAYYPIDLLCRGHQPVQLFSRGISYLSLFW